MQQTGRFDAWPALTSAKRDRRDIKLRIRGITAKRFAELLSRSRVRLGKKESRSIIGEF
jgi:hypothetical protein